MMRRLLAWIVPARALRKIGKTDNMDYFLGVLSKVKSASALEWSMGLAILAMNEESEW